MTTLTAACVQVNAGTEIGPNLAIAADLARRAREDGATLIALPENVAALRLGRRAILECAFAEADHPALAAFRDLARELDAFLLVGTLAVRLPGDAEGNEQAAARSFLIDPSGDIAARYDKMHMFDVDLPGGESYRESATYRPGQRPVVAAAPWGRLGMTVCYDVRFPQLYRALAKAGADIVSVPAAFTRQTGQAHWQTLLRARAIETGCFVIAPAQTGTHDRGRETYGHSLIVDPWGVVLADGGEDVGIITATLDLDRVTDARHAIPALQHDRDIPLVDIAEARTAASA